MASHQRVISEHEGAMLREIAEYDRAEAWRGEGFLSMEAWLAARCRMSDARARTLVSTARRTEDLPRMAEALNAAGYRTPHGQPFTSESVRQLVTRGGPSEAGANTPSAGRKPRRSGQGSATV